MLDWGIWTIFFFLPVYYWGWYSTKLLSMFWFFLLGIGVLSLRRRSLDYLILSLCDFYYYYSVCLSLRFVIIVKSFSILLILAISRIIRFFFWLIFSNFTGLNEEANGDPETFYFMIGNFTGGLGFLFLIYRIKIWNVILLLSLFHKIIIKLNVWIYSC